MNQRELLKVKEAAAIANIGLTMAYGLVASKEWPSIKVGRVVRVPREELDAWIRRQIREQNPGLAPASA